MIIIIIIIIIIMMMMMMMIASYSCSLSIDIDDCAEHPCENYATCYDLVDDYNCTCPDGWTGKNCDISKF